MITRVWQGRVSPDKATDYLKLMRKVGLPDYRATPGNISAWCLYRPEGNDVVVKMLTFWEDADAVARYAGRDITKARYYDFDFNYLTDMPINVEHFSVLAR
jgi:quinol monooxygenase YgiN